MLLDFVYVWLAGLSGSAVVLNLATDGLGVMPVWERRRPRTVVLDNASAHMANAFQGIRPRCTVQGAARSGRLGILKLRDWVSRLEEAVDSLCRKP